MQPRKRPSTKSVPHQLSLRQLLIYLIILHFALSSLFVIHFGFPGENRLMPVGPQSIKEWYDTKIHTRKSIVVVYTGPTETDREIGKNWLYLTNFDYFLLHGIDCNHQDTVLVLTDPVAQYYDAMIRDIQMKCGRGTQALRVVKREDKCYDMEGFRTALTLDLSQYDYLVYLNCGIVGPRIAATSAEPPTSWTNRYISMLSDHVKMSGLSINCEYSPHVQSFLFAVDKIGLDLIKSAVYDCKKPNSEMNEEDRLMLIQKYEIGMGRAILDAGYGLRSTHGLLGPTEVSPQNWVPNNLPWLCAGDIWHLPNLIGAIPPSTKWEDIMFFKTSRFLILPGMEEELHYGHEELFDTVWPDNPYTLLYWDNLPVKVQEAANVLGLNKDLWNQDEITGTPDIFLKDWDELSDKETTAAIEAGFNEGNWYDTD